MIWKKIFYVFVFFLFATRTFAQHDSTFYKEYPDKLIISLYNSFASQNNIAFSQKITKDSLGKSAFHYYADANVISGIEIDYDIFSLAFAYKVVPPQNANRKGSTYYSGLGLNLGGDKWKLETSYKSYKGFYDINTPNYIHPFTDTTPYYQNHSMTTENFKAKFIYIINTKKFSYDAAYSCDARQIKSAFTWIAISNLYYNSLRTDTSFIPYPLRSYYKGYANLNGLNVIGFSEGLGFSATLVLFHRFFGNITSALEPEAQWRRYSYASVAEPNLCYLTSSGDTRISFGYNGKRFFFFFTFIADYTNYNKKQLLITNDFYSGSSTIGYRFGVRKPGFYKKFEKTKIYLWLE
jgi:hypothetical protein